MKCQLTQGPERPLKRWLFWFVCWLVLSWGDIKRGWQSDFHFRKNAVVIVLNTGPEQEATDGVQ